MDTKGLLGTFVLAGLIATVLCEGNVEPLKCYHCSENDNCNSNLGVAQPCRTPYERCATFYSSGSADEVSARGCWLQHSKDSSPGCYEDFSGVYVCACGSDFCNDFAIQSIEVGSKDDLKKAVRMSQGKVPLNKRDFVILKGLSELDEIKDETETKVEQKPLSLAAKLTKQSMSNALRDSPSIIPLQKRDFLTPLDFDGPPKNYKDAKEDRSQLNSAIFQGYTGNGKPLIRSAAGGLPLPPKKPSSKKEALVDLARNVEQWINPEARPGSKDVKPVLDSRGVPINFIGPESEEKLYFPRPKMFKVEAAERPRFFPVNVPAHHGHHGHHQKPVHFSAQPNQHHQYGHHPTNVPHQQSHPTPKMHPTNPHPSAQPAQNVHPAFPKPVAEPANFKPANQQPSSNQPMINYAQQALQKAVLTIPTGAIGDGQNQTAMPSIAVVVVPPVVTNTVAQPAETKPKYQQPQEPIRYVPVEVKTDQAKKPGLFKSLLKSAVDKILS